MRIVLLLALSIFCFSAAAQGWKNPPGFYDDHGKPSTGQGHGGGDYFPGNFDGIKVPVNDETQEFLRQQREWEKANSGKPYEKKCVNIDGKLFCEK